jgi:hypothetical protein
MNATFWVVGMRLRNGACGPGWSVIFSGSGAGGNFGIWAR